jgi:hypothetical protein
MAATLTKQAGVLLSELDNILSEFRVVKTAAVKKGEANTEPAGVSSTHPTTKVDDGTMPAHEGAQTAANTASIKEMVPDNVNSAPVDPTSQTTQQLQEGTKKTPTGGDPAVERDFTGDTKDPGTTHPAKADDGVKYGSMTFEQLRVEHAKQANAWLADLKTALPQIKQAQVNPTPAQAAPQQQVQPTDAQRQQQFELEKHAAIEQIVRDAHFAAFQVCDIIHGQVKRAAEGGEEESKKPKEPEGGDGGKPTPAPPPDGGGPPAPAGMPPGMAGGGAPAPGGDPTGGGGGGGGDVEQALNEFLMALHEQGYTPDQAMQLIAQLLQGGGGAGGPPGGDPTGGGGGGMPPGPGGAADMPPAKAAADRTQKLNTLNNWCKAAADFQRQGKFKWKKAKSGSSKRELRDNIKAAIRDTLGR